MQKAATRGVIGGQAADTVRTLMAGDSSVMAQFPNEKEGVPVAVRLSRGQRTGPEDIAALLFTPISGGMNVPATDIGKLIKKEGSYPLMRKDLQPVVMVQAESTQVGPGYAMQDISALLEKDGAANAPPLMISWKDQIVEGGSRVLNWAGEWTIERDIYSDLGTAFIAVLFLIYAMLVAWYGSFLIPVIVMLPIPLIFIGVIPAHALLGQALNGAGTIGVIGLAGIVLRNSILLVDFARSHIADGMTVKEAVLQACSLRARPIIITALAIILGESVLYFDETLRGLGITMPSGTLISTLLTLGVVPVAYYQLASLQQKRAIKK